MCQVEVCLVEVRVPGGGVPGGGVPGGHVPMNISYSSTQYLFASCPGNSNVLL